MYSQVTDPYAQPLYGHTILTLADEEYIRTPTGARPSICLDEIQEELPTECGMYISLAATSQTLTWMNCSKKSLSCRAAERDEGL